MKGRNGERSDNRTDKCRELERNKEDRRDGGVDEESEGLK
jgi:hypothetical protein